MNTIANILLFIMFYGLVCGMLNLIQSKFNYKLIIKLPKNKKWVSKADPIYAIRKSNWDSNYYVVHKYSLGYQINEIIYFLSIIFIPFPVRFETYKYWVMPDYYMLEKEKLSQIIDIGEWYENKYQNQMDEYLKAQKIKEAENEALNKLNTIFTKNYENK